MTVHNHGPAEGRGLDCGEQRQADGTLRGHCLTGPVEPTSPIYTTSINEQCADVAINSILWRLAVATGLAQRGQGGANLDPNDVLLEAERQLLAAREAPAPKPKPSFAEFAESLGLKLLPWQLEAAQAILDGRVYVYGSGRSMGRTLVAHTVDRYLKETS